MGNQRYTKASIDIHRNKTAMLLIISLGIICQLTDVSNADYAGSSTFARFYIGSVYYVAGSDKQVDQPTAVAKCECMGGKLAQLYSFAKMNPVSDALNPYKTNKGGWDFSKCTTYWQFWVDGLRASGNGAQTNIITDENELSDSETGGLW